MAHASLLLLWALAQDVPGFKIAAALTEAPERRLLCEGTAETPDGVVLNVELFIDGRAEPLGRLGVRVKDGRFSAPFDHFKSAERVLPGAYRARISYHPAFQVRPLEDVTAFQLYVPLKLGTPDDVITAHRLVRERLIKDLKEFGVIGDDIRTAFEAAKGKIDPADWARRSEGWKARCKAVEARAAKDPEYAALAYTNITMSGTEHLRDQVRFLIAAGGAGQEADLQAVRERLDSMIRTMILETAPAGSTSAERRALVGQARGAVVSALDTEGPAFAACRRAFTEAMFKLSLKAPPEARDALLTLSAQGVAYFEEAEAGRERARALQPALDKRLDEVLQLMIRTE